MKFLAFVILVSCASINNSFAAPLFISKPEEAARSESIIVAEYIGYRLPKEGKIDYFVPPVATYKIIEVFKGALQPQDTVEILYSFHDASACIAEQGWKFSEKLMPAKGSRWILFIERRAEDSGEVPYSTYRGDYGRWPANDKNLVAVRGMIK